jgi:hypothetical protein
LGAGDRGCSLRSTPGSFLQPLRGGWWVEVVRGSGGRFVVDRHPSAGHGGPGSRDGTGTRGKAQNTRQGTRAVKSGADWR